MHIFSKARTTRGLIGTDATPLPDLRLDQRDEPRALPLRGGARAVRDLRRAHRVRRRPLRVLRRLQVGLPVLQDDGARDEAVIHVATSRAPHHHRPSGVTQSAAM